MQLLRHWYAAHACSSYGLIVMSLDGSVEIAVGHQCRLVLSEGVAHHFAVKAMEMIKMVSIQVQRAGMARRSDRWRSA